MLININKNHFMQTKKKLFIRTYHKISKLKYNIINY